MRLGKDGGEQVPAFPLQEIGHDRDLALDAREEAIVERDEAGAAHRATTGSHGVGAVTVDDLAHEPLGTAPRRPLGVVEAPIRHLNAVP